VTVEPLAHVEGAAGAAPCTASAFGGAGPRR
jgi:hypothetical protein